MRTQTLLQARSISARFITVFFMLATLSMSSLLAHTLLVTEVTTGDLDAVARTMSIDDYTGPAGALVIPDSLAVGGVNYAIVDIENNAFQNNGLTDLQLPSSLIRVGLRAFQQNSITSAITIPASVETIVTFGFADQGAGGIIFEDGSHLESIEVNAFRGATITLPTVREGYTVTWTSGGAVVDPVGVSGAGAYEGVWVSSSAAASVLSLDANTGVGTMIPVTSTVGATEALPVNTFTKAGYYFKGWAAAADGDVLYADGADFEFVNEVEQLYAVWGELCDLVLDNGEGVQETYVVGLDLTQAIPASTFVKEGYYLYGWATTTEGDAYYSFEALYTPSLATQTLYAIWEPIPAGYVSMGSEMLKITEFTPVIVDQTLSITSYTESGQDSTYFYIPSSYVIDGVVYTVTELGEMAFMAKGLTSIVLPSTLTTLGTRALHNNNLDSVIIPASVTKFSDFALAYNYYLKKVIFEPGSQLQSIGANAFVNHAALDSITIPASVKWIGYNAFDGSTLAARMPNSLLKVQFEEGSQLDSIAAGAFDFCTALDSIILPSIRPGVTLGWKKDDVVLADYVVMNADLASVFTSILVGIPTAVAELAVKTQLVISPNPADQSFNINVDAVSTDIYSLSGKCVKQFPMGVSTFDVSSLERGIYFVKVQQANGKICVEQLIKK